MDAVDAKEELGHLRTIAKNQGSSVLKLRELVIALLDTERAECWCDASGMRGHTQECDRVNQLLKVFERGKKNGTSQ